MRHDASLKSNFVCITFHDLFQFVSSSQIGTILWEAPGELEESGSLGDLRG